MAPKSCDGKRVVIKKFPRQKRARIELTKQEEEAELAEDMAAIGTDEIERVLKEAGFMKPADPEFPVLCSAYVKALHKYNDVVNHLAAEYITNHPDRSLESFRAFLDSTCSWEKYYHEFLAEERDTTGPLDSRGATSSNEAFGGSSAM